MKNLLICCAFAMLCACGTPARVSLPPSAELQAGHRAGEQLIGQPVPAMRIRPGDTLRIVRDTGEAPSISAFTANSIYELTLFQVTNDGTISYPYAGQIKVAGLTLMQLTAVLEDKLKNIYRDATLTINFNQAPGNTVFIGGAVRNPNSVPVTTITTLEQALAVSGGLLPVGDAHNVALFRLSDDGKYHTYFFDYNKFLFASNSGPVMLQRGDIVFVPRSTVGNNVEWIDLYLNQLLPFTKSIGIGATYDMNTN